MKKLFFVFLALLAVGLASNVAFANGPVVSVVPYIDANGDEGIATNVTSLISPGPTNPLPTTLATGWYVVQGNVTYNTRLLIPNNGTVNLILANGAHLNATRGINVPLNATLTIFAQSVSGSPNIGRVTAIGNFATPGIGVQGGSGGNIRINGGAITANGGMFAAGIGGGVGGHGGNITISSGSVTTTGGFRGAGIGGGEYGAGGVITISGGDITAIGGGSAAGIGGGGDGGGHGGTITITGGNIVATGGNGAAGIGGGDEEGNGGNITISGGDVTAIGGNNGAGIGGGEWGNGGNITITGGTIEVIAGSAGNAAAIGRGRNGADGIVTITGTYDFITNTSPYNPAATRQTGTETFNGTVVTHIPLSNGRVLNTLRYVSLEPASEPPPSGGPLGDIPVGTRVYLRESGVRVPFIVVQQGRPAGLLPNGNFNRPMMPASSMFVRNTEPITAYANWDGATILMRERVLNPMAMGNSTAAASGTGNVFRRSAVFAWLNDTYFRRLNTDIRNQVLDMTIPVVDCNGGFHTMGILADPPGIGKMYQRVWIRNINARVWLPHAAEVGIPWHVEGANHTAASVRFPSSQAVIHWMPGAGTTWQQWNNGIRFAYFAFGHGTNPSSAAASTAMTKRIAYCDNEIVRMWWTRCPSHQSSPHSATSGIVNTGGGGGVRLIRYTAWVRPTMGFPNTLYVTACNEVTISPTLPSPSSEIVRFCGFAEAILLNDTMEYRRGRSGGWIQVDQGQTSLPVTLINVNIIYQVRTRAANGNNASVALDVTVPGRLSAPSVSYRPATDDIRTTSTAMEFSLDGGTTWTRATGTNIPRASIGHTAITVYVRTAATATAAASNIRSVDVPNDPVVSVASTWHELRNLINDAPVNVPTTIAITNNFVASFVDGNAIEIPQNRNITLVSSNPNIPRTLTQSNYGQRHFIVRNSNLTLGRGITLCGEHVCQMFSSETQSFDVQGKHDFTEMREAYIRLRYMLLEQDLQNENDIFADALFESILLESEDAHLSPLSLSFGTGGVYVRDNGVFTMDAGSIIRNAVGFLGGGVQIRCNGTFNMNAGSVIENNQAEVGGAVHLFGIFLHNLTTFNMNGGIIRNNQASDAGAMEISINSRVNMSGGTITNNHAHHFGGVLVGGGFDCTVANGRGFNMTGGSITNNTSNNGAGGISISLHALPDNVFVGSAAVITGNTQSNTNIPQLGLNSFEFPCGEVEYTSPLIPFYEDTPLCDNVSAHENTEYLFPHEYLELWTIENGFDIAE